MATVDRNVPPCTELAWRPAPPDLGRFENYVSLLVSTSVGRVLRSKIDAADVVQEILLRAHQHLSQFAGATEAQFAAWLRQIAMNTLSDQWRRYELAESRNASRERSLEAILDQSSQVLGNLLASSGTTPSQAAQRRDLGVALADALAELGEDQRTVLVWRSLRECSWDEVAREMGRSKGAVRMLWVRALQELRPLVEARLR